jgi:hypothetical protein
MDCGHINIVCYAGGTCGDLISAILDPREAVLNTQAGTVELPHHRIKLKKPHLFELTADRNQYLQTIDAGTCISSHDLEYHVDERHQFISVTVQDFDVALWAAQRFKNLHRPHVWQEMQARCGAGTVEQYAQTLIDYSNMVVKKTCKIIPLESIVSAQATSTVQNVLGITVGLTAKNFYRKWLDLQQL